MAAASFPQTLIPLVCSITLLLALATTPGDATSFTKHFNRKLHQLSSMALQGDAHYLNETDEIGLIRLTKTDESGKALEHSAGRIYYLEPLQFWGEGMQIDFEARVQFIIRANSDADPADGLTFFMEPLEAPIGAAGASFGEFDSSGKKNKTFAVEFDTYVNTNIDPNYRHVGIDIESNDSVLTMEVNELVGKVVTAAIDYKAATTMIRVTVTIGSDTYEMSYWKDLSTLLPKEVKFGFSAATGGQASVHDIISWSFKATEVVNGIRQVV